MLRRLRIENFMSIKSEVVELAPLTVFIGPNASGKSAIFKALVTLTRLLDGAPVRGPSGEFELEPGVTLDRLVWKGDSGLTMRFEVWWSEDLDDSPGYTLELSKDSRGWNVARERMRFGNSWFDSSREVFSHKTERVGEKTWQAPYRATLCHLVSPFENDQIAAPYITPLLTFREKFGEVRRYRPSASDIASFVAEKAPRARGTEQVGTKKARKDYVRENGRNLSLELQNLQGEDREVFGDIEQGLSELFPHIRFINFQHDRLGVRLAFTTYRSEDLVPAPQESDGALLTTFLLWRLYSAPAGLRICLEEPENGVHPWLLGERYRLLKRFSTADRVKRPMQILVATHSPDFLGSIEDRNELLDIVRVVEFDSRHGTKVHRLGDINQIDRLLSVFNDDLGELWWSGAIGAVPTPPPYKG